MEPFNLKKQSSSPQVGIFWLYQGQILQFSQPVNEVAPIAGFRDSGYTHDQYWSQVQSMFPELKDKEYFSVPRGRVLFVVNGTYKIMLPTKESGNAILVQRISRNFDLPRGKVVVESDGHYDPASDADFED